MPNGNTESFMPVFRSERHVSACRKLQGTCGVAVSAGAVRFPTPIGEMERTRPSPADIGREKHGAPVLVRSTTLKVAEASGAAHRPGTWGVAETLRLSAWLLAMTACMAILWLTGSTLVDVLRPH